MADRSGQRSSHRHFRGTVTPRGQLAKAKLPSKETRTARKWGHYHLKEKQE